MNQENAFLQPEEFAKRIGAVYEKHRGADGVAKMNGMNLSPTNTPYRHLPIVATCAAISLVHCHSIMLVPAAYNGAHIWLLPHQSYCMQANTSITRTD